MSVDRTVTLTPRERLHKKAAKALVEAVGGTEPAALACRAAKSQLSDYGHRNVRTFMPSDVIADLETIAAEPVMTRFLAASAGYLLVPRLDRLPDGAWGRSLQALGKEFGDVTSRLCDALGDPDSPGQLTAGEIHEKNIIRELDELAGQVAVMRAMAMQVLEEAGA